MATGGFALAVTSASGFEQKLSGIQAVSGATEDQMKLVSAAALRIGKDSVFSASESADAIEEILKAGVSLEDVLNGAADATVSLAAAGGVSLPEAATIAANALNNFKLSGQEMPKVADLIAGAANASAIDVSQFGQSLSQAGAVANLSGLKFNDLAVAIAEMGQAGIKGSDAGTSIKTFLTNLIPTTDQQIKLFEKMGLVSVNTGGAMAKLAAKGIKPTSLAYDDVMDSLQKYIVASGQADEGSAKAYKLAQQMGNQLGVLSNRFFDAKGNAKSMADIQGVLAEATQGMTREQKLQNLEVLFGSDALRAAAVFSDQGAEGYNKMADAMGKVTAAQVAAVRLDNMRGALEQLKGSLETAYITIGTLFLPVITRIIKAVTAVVNVFNNAPPALQRFLGIVVALGGGMSLLAGIGIKLLFVLIPLLAKFLGFAALKSVFSILTTGFGALRGGAGIVGALSATIGRAGTVFGRFASIGRILFGVLTRIPGVLAVLRVAGAAAFGPWGIAIALVVTALTVLYNRFQPFHDAVNRIAAAIKGGFIEALNGARVALQLMVDGFNGATGGSGLVGFFQSVGAGARILWTELQRVGDAFTTSVLPALREAGSGILASLREAFTTIASAVRGQLMPALRQLGAALAPLQPYLAKIGGALLVFGGFLLKAVGFVLKLAVVLTGGLVIGLIRLAALIVSAVLPAIIRFVGFLTASVIPAIAKVVAGFINFVAAGAAFVSAIVGFFTGAKAAADTGAGGIQAALTGIAGFFTDAFTTARDAVVGVLTGIYNFIVGVMSTIGGGISAGLSGIAGFFIAAFNGIVGFLTGVFNSIVGAIRAGMAVIGNIWRAFWTSGFGQVVLAAFGLIGDIIQLGLAVLQLLFNLFLAGIRVVWNLLWTSLVQPVIAFATQLPALVTVALTFLRTQFTNFVAAVRAIWNVVWATLIQPVVAFFARVVGVLSAGMAFIRSVVSTGLSFLRGIFSAVFGALVAIVGARVAAIRARMAAGWASVRAVTSAAWNAVRAAVAGPIAAVVAVVSSRVAAIRARISAAWNYVKSATSAAWSKFASTISTKISAAIAKVNSIRGRVVGALSGAGSWLVSAGRNVVQGLINGIGDMIGRARAKVQELAGLVKQAAAAALKIGSPSRVFHQYGLWTVEGFINGLDAMAPKLEANMSGLFPTPVSANVAGMAAAPTIVMPAAPAAVQQQAFPKSVKLVVGGREFDAYIEGSTQGVLTDTSAQVRRGSK